MIPYPLSPPYPPDKEAIEKSKKNLTKKKKKGEKKDEREDSKRTDTGL
jgi:hypothetical protein